MTAVLTRPPLLRWTVIGPALALLVLALTWGRDPGALVLGVVAVLLGVAVLAAVQHAEVVAHHVGEPYGSLLLAVAVTVIEVGLILTPHALEQGRHDHAGPGHRLRRRDDHRQRHPRPLPAGRVASA